MTPNMETIEFKSKQALRLELESFQGPFDLLLHLIKQMKVDINDIPMSEITAQYMVYLKSMQELALDQVGDYLVMAATLLEIKSRLLLPIEPDQQLDGDYEAGDPRQALVQQLLLYQQFQEVSTALEVKQTQRAALYSREVEDLSDYQQFIPLQSNELSLERLVQAMQEALQRELLRTPKEKQIHHDPQTVEQKMEEIMLRLEQVSLDERLTFQQLMQQGTKRELITVFMAVLELVRKQFVIFFQTEPLAPIEIQKVEVVSLDGID